MQNWFSQIGVDIFERMGRFWSSFGETSRLPFVVLDIFLVTLLFYWLYILIRETRAWRIFLGLLVILLVMLMAKILGLVTLNWIFKNFLTALVVAIPVVFQPELRTALEKIGRIRLAEFPQKKKEWEKIIDEVVTACDLLSKSQTGALIVFQRRTGLKDYAETGTILDAEVSANLLLNIFQKKAPLHDGAVIIANNRIKAAGCLLPLDNARTDSHYGTRHQSALTLSQETDALIVVVSEETGAISLAFEGQMNSGISSFDLKHALLSGIFQRKK